MSEALEVIPQEVAITKLANFQSTQEMMDYAQVLITSKLVPAAFNTPEKVVAAIQTGRELGFGPMSSMNNLHVIQGRATLSVHALGALMKKKGIITKTIKDFEPVKNDQGVAVDAITTIRFYQPSPVGYIEEDVSFRHSEAKSMGLLQKDPWVKMVRVMMWTRCFSIGCRRVAPDAILGLYETSEAADFSNSKTNYSITEEGEVKVLNLN